MTPVAWRGSGSTGSSAPSCVPMARNHRLCHSDRAGTPRIVRVGPSNLNGANGLGLQEFARSDSFVSISLPMLT
jgi:hypothetical protein